VTCSFVAEQTGITFVDKILIREKDFAIPDVEALEARLYFKSFYGEESLSLRTQLDITQFDRIYLPAQTRRLIHPYSDSNACAAMLICHKLEEILASKLTTLLHRRNPLDLFDLLYAIVFRDQFGVNRREVITTFLRKSIFESEPSAARDLLRAVPVSAFRDLWKSVVAPVASLFNFDFVVANFYGLIDALFELVIALAAGGAGAFQEIAPTRRQCPRASTTVKPVDVLRSHRQSPALTNNWG
jgi:Nucleotidyl transferase AbiEii toxin, Type IV TA system